MLVLAHLYAKTDSASLATLRSALQRKRYTAAEIGVGAGVAISLTAGSHLATPSVRTSHDVHSLVLVINAASVGPALPP